MAPGGIAERPHDEDLWNECERLREELAIERKLRLMLMERNAILQDEAYRLSARLVDLRVNPTLLDFPEEIPLVDDPESAFGPMGLGMVHRGRAD